MKVCDGDGGTNLDLLGGIGHEDGRVGVRRRHLAARALQGGEELGMDEGRLRGWVAHAVGVVSEQTEVGILVDAHGD